MTKTGTIIIVAAIQIPADQISIVGKRVFTLMRDSLESVCPIIRQMT